MWPDKPIAFVILDEDKKGRHFGLFKGDALKGRILSFLFYGRNSISLVIQFSVIRAAEEEENTGKKNYIFLIHGVLLNN